jgi:hypothetical protein
MEAIGLLGLRQQACGVESLFESFMHFFLFLAPSRILSLRGTAGGVPEPILR